jgi:pectin methylesterase-like acyl-CoA thioesterase
MIAASMTTFRLAALLACLAVTAPAWAGPSVYRTAPDDPKAVTVRATGDGVADDSAAIQQALDAVSNRGAGGLVFLPSGRYRVTRTIFGGKDRRTLFILTHHALYAVHP